MSVTIDPTRKKRRGLVITIVLAVVAILAAAVVFLLPGKPAPAPAKPLNVASEKISRGDLVELVRAQGTLSYSTPRKVGTTLTGVVTSLPPVGTIVSVGNELFRIDNAPVLLMHGDVPAWRSIAPGMTPGPDIVQLEQGLIALGYLWGEPSEKFTSDTAAGIRAWQKDLGIAVTGEIELGTLFFTPQDVRISGHKAAVGDAASAEIITVTGSTKEIRAFIDPSQQSLAPVESKVNISLPGGKATTGKITAVGGPVEKENGEETSLKIPLTIIPDDAKAIADFDNANVSVSLSNTKAKDVLLLPVSALLAQPGGGYKVDVLVPKPAAGQPATRSVTVELGAFADGFVAVTGGKLSEGDNVVVAK